MTRLERAKQFMPFVALHGYEETVRKKEFVKASRRELTEEEIERLSDAVSRIKKGDVVRVKYYSGDGYTETEGAVSEINLTMRYIRVVKTSIAFEDIYDLKETR